MSLTTKAIDPLHFRKALGHFASGLTVITSQIEDEPIGFTCQSFYSVSTAPPEESVASWSRTSTNTEV